MDEAHLAAAVPYVALNPLRARLVPQAEDWRWSSVHAHLNPVRGDGLTDTAPIATRFDDFAALLRAGEDEAASMALRRADTIGRPLGDKRFQDRVNAAFGREPAPKERGRKAELSALSPRCPRRSSPSSATQDPLIYVHRRSRHSIVCQGSYRHEDPSSHAG
jgi:putative transposase